MAAVSSIFADIVTPNQHKKSPNERKPNVLDEGRIDFELRLLALRALPLLGILGEVLDLERIFLDKCC
ncbi:hypothetical protein Aduo_013171 [Ancylostoma duodenale]